jgi:(p)ppGpp synthase/HD superfamily hydrolase
MSAVIGERAQIAAVLHDVLEDSPVTLEQLEAEGFSPAVLRLWTV